MSTYCDPLVATYGEVYRVAPICARAAEVQVEEDRAAYGRVYRCDWHYVAGWAVFKWLSHARYAELERTLIVAEGA